MEGPQFSQGALGSPRESHSLVLLDSSVVNGMRLRSVFVQGKAARASSSTGRWRLRSSIAKTIFSKYAASSSSPPARAQRLVLQKSLKKLASPRSRTESEHETMRAGLRIHHSGVTIGIDCDNALKNGGFAAAREGVDDMDWGVRHGHRGQNAPLLLVNDSQSGRQVL